MNKYFLKKLLTIQKLTKKVRSFQEPVHLRIFQAGVGAEIWPMTWSRKEWYSKRKGPAIEMELPFSGGEKRSKDWAEELRKKVCLRSSEARYKLWSHSEHQGK